MKKILKRSLIVILCLVSAAVIAASCALFVLAQKEKAIEELGELARALARDLQGEGDRANIAEEMADVYIMLSQLQLIYGNRPEIAGCVRKKMARTMETVTKEREGP